MALDGIGKLTVAPSGDALEKNVNVVPSKLTPIWNLSITKATIINKTNPKNVLLMTIFRTCRHD